MVGQNIGKYRVIDRVGRGGMGTVYRAVDETLHREVAIKVLNAELSDPAVAKRFRAEAVTVARLNHPGIATIYELFQNEGQWLMVMEFVRGETLEALVARKGIVPLEEAVGLCMQTLGALAHAHGLGVVHRDLKPANLMVTESGNLKVMDFGIARVAGTEHLTSAGFMMGTPAYMAPEQVLGQDIDARADLYAVGVVLYYLTTAKLPFKGDTPFEMARSRIQDQPTPIQVARPESPAWLGQVLDIALARQPERRFPTAPIFREALRRGLANLPIETPTTTNIPPELIVTTPPGSMPTLSAPPPAPPAPPIAPVAPAASAATTAAAASAPTGPPPSAPPVVLSIPAAGAAAPLGTTPKPGTGSTTKRSLTGPLVGVAATALVLATVGGLFWSRSHHVPAEAPADATPPAAATVTAPPAPASSAPAPEASAATASAPVGSTPPSSAPPAATTADASPTTAANPASQAAALSPPPAVTATAAAPSPTTAKAPSRASTSTASAGRNPNAAASPSATGSASTAPGRSTAGAGGTTKSSTSASARGRNTTPAAQTDDPHLAFGDLHALVVTGTKTDEEQVSVHFFSGQISVILQKNGATMALVPYRQFVRATYVHAKAPKWDPKLTAPPADVDMPGGLFRSAHHWLTLQAKSTYVILRLNDDDFQRVLDTVTSRMGVKVDAPASD